ncbi:MAG: hypothetical protein AAGA68_18940 [Pseudomonadota bacterium]
MRILSATIAACLVIALTCATHARAEVADNQVDDREIAAFFDGYLAVYNRSFGHPERRTQFREELSAKVLMPIMQSPPSRAPRVPDSIESFTQGFAAFVTRLEGKGVTRLEWVSREYQVLSVNKVLANNVGIGITADGEVAYETASLYLLHRTEGGWKIVMFSPYDHDKLFQLGCS